MENSEEIAVSDQYKIQEIMNEISECREDERNSRNQIFTILAVVTTKGQAQETANKENIKSLLNEEKLLKSTIIHDTI